MALIRVLLLVAVACTLGACGGMTPSGETGADKRQLNGFPDSASTSRKSSVAKNDSAPQPDKDAVRKVALDLTAVSDPESKAYKIGPGDVLDVTVFKVPDLSKTVQVSETGTINYPLVGDVAAAGKTGMEVEQSLTKSLGAKYLQRPQVSVFVKEHNSQRFTMEGAIKKPGVYPIAGGLSLLQAVALSGGFEATADETVVVFRQVDGKRSAAKFDVSEIRAGKVNDPQLQAGDVIIVPTSDVKEGVNNVMRLLPLVSVFALL